MPPQDYRNIIFYCSYRSFSSARVVVFTVIDSFGSPSEQATVRVTFDAIDDTPVVDLNGPQAAGVNYSIDYNEGSPAIQVSK